MLMRGLHNPQHLVDVRKLGGCPAVCSTASQLLCLQPPPVLEGDHADARGTQCRLHPSSAFARRSVRTAEVLEHAGGGLPRIGDVRGDDALGPALHPAGHVEARSRPPLGSSRTLPALVHATLPVRHSPLPVERQALHGREVETNAPQHQPAGNVLNCTRGGANGPLASRWPLELRALQAYGADAGAVGPWQDGSRRSEETQPDDALGGRLALCEVRGHLLEDVQRALLHAALGKFLLTGGITAEHELFGVDDGEHLVADCQQLPELRIREGCLHEAAPADEVHGPEAPRLPLAEPRQRACVDVRGVQLPRRAEQEARDVQRHVALAQDHRSVARRGRLQLGVVRVAVVPLHEGGRAHDALEVLAGNAQHPLALGPGADHDGVVGRAQCPKRQVPAQLHIAEEAEGGQGGDLRKVLDHVLDLGVVRGDAEAHEAEGRREPLEHVHAQAVLVRPGPAGGALQQVL
mmetsp:Transcript_64103/g.202583  ORF Transcript_64103/g.202583 Transcript_64103/m.202583 type:complete len:464 (+) Transcript_64103:96-1487(+)